MDRAHRRVIFASSLGTVFEWYDFYLYGSLAAIISKQFFAGVNETTAFIFALLAFAAGFAVRPFGAILFGRLGDMVGRKHTFLITIVIMGVSTALVGILPSYASIGVAAPIALVVLRLLQGLALGGEYGGAATYVAEHAPPGKRGLYTSWIQTTATLGLFLSLLVILGCRQLLGPEFETWGWRIPFLLSIILLAISVYIRLQLSESPVFLEMKSAGTTSRAPLTDSFARWPNLKIVLLALLGATAGQAVVWYGGQFYSLFFLTQTLKVDAQTANLLVAGALVLATPFFVVFGWLSDRIGRKKIVLGGCLLAAVTYFPLFGALTHFANPAIERARQTSPIVVVADPADCHFQFDPIGKARFTSSCDIAKSALAKSGAPYENEAAPSGAVASVRIGDVSVVAFDGGELAAGEFKERTDAFAKQLTAALRTAGLSVERGSGSDQSRDGAADPHRARAVRDDGVRTDRRVARRAVPGTHPLHVDVVAVSHRQRLVRRIPADGVVRARRADRRYLLRAVVPDRRRGRDDDHRCAVLAGQARRGDGMTL